MTSDMSRRYTWFHKSVNVVIFTHVARRSATAGPPPARDVGAAAGAVGPLDRPERPAPALRRRAPRRRPRGCRHGPPAGRVFAALMATEGGRLTSSEPATPLDISPAGVSGAVRSLIQVRMIRRERERGSRRDVYVGDG